MTASELDISAADGKTFSAYFARPDAPTAPVVIVLQEIFGVNANIRAIADGFATLGYIAVAPDLFWRQEPGVRLDPSSAADRERAMTLLQKLDETAALEDVLAVVKAAKALPGASGKVGVVGFCLGGKLAFLLATSPLVDVAVSYYGTGIHQKLGQAPEIRARLLLHVARADHLCPPEAQTEIETKLAPYAPLVSLMFYDGASHAFAREGGATFNAAEAARANQATNQLLAKAFS